MSEIRAVVVDPNAKGRLSLKPVPAPVPAVSEALVRVRAISLNLGEIRRSLAADPGWRPGWDFAGTVEKPAADGSGPKAGDRVVGFLPAGAWAEVVAAPVTSIAVIPDSVTFERAATLPVAGMTALLALEKNGSLIGRSVLITGASGGVGNFAIQLAHHAGATVIASVRRREREKNALAAGADQVIVGLDQAAKQLDPFHLILESVGAQSLTAALGMLRRGGMCVLYGTSEDPHVTFDARQFYSSGGILYGFILFFEVTRISISETLGRLAGMVGDERLKTPIEVQASWTEIGPVAERYWNREIAGKAVLTF
jgi:NADPH:quinone reductase-like Zn-dependent oxidoreductase